MRNLVLSEVDVDTSTPIESARPRAGRADGPTVLLLQSVSDSREMYARFFAYLGWRAVPLATGRELLALASHASVIVTDIVSHDDLDPYGLISDLKRDHRTKHVPVAVVTAWVQTTCRERAEEAGCDAYLVKPCLPDDLLAVLVRLIAGATIRRQTRPH